MNTRCYPVIEAYTPFYLASDHRLSEHAIDASEGQDMMTWAEAAPFDSIEHRSGPFTDGAMLAGPMAAQLEVTSSNANLQLVLDVFDEADDGTRVLITHGSILGSRRRTDPDRSWSDENGLPARPYLTLDEDEPLTPQEATSLDVPLWPTIWSIEPGHRLVLKIAVQPESASCANPLGVPVGCFPTESMKASLRDGVYAIHYDGSLLSLPLLEHGALPTAKPAVSPTGAEAFPLPIVW